MNPLLRQFRPIAPATVPALAAAIALLLAVQPGPASATPFQGGGSPPDAAAPASSSAAPSVDSDEARGPLAEDVPAASMRVLRDPRRRTLVIEAGPVDLPAARAYGEPLPLLSVRGVTGVDGWIRSFRVEVVDGTGRAIPVPVLHHAALLAPDRAELFRDRARRIVAFGMETSAIELPGQLGYRIEPADSVLLVAAFFNASDEAFEGVRVRLVMQYADARLDYRYTGVLPVYMDAASPEESTFPVPPGGVRQSHEWSPKVAGRILGLGGHLHPFGVSLILEDVASGEVLWTGHGEYDDHGELTGVSRSFFLRGIAIRPDRRYRVTAVYENPTGEVIEGAMGHVAGLFLPDGRAEVPPVDRAAADYVADLYTQEGGGGHAHHHH